MYQDLMALINEYEEYFMDGGIQQSLQDINNLIREIGDNKFNNMVEIGIADGGTLWLYTQLFGAPGAIITVVDMDIRAVTARVISALEEKGFKFNVIMSQSMDVILEGPIDFLHIDGDHGYEAVKYDYEMHSKHMTPGGVIIIHDTLLIAGPSQLRQEIEASGTKSQTFHGTDTLCSCFGPNRINPNNRAFGTTVIWK